MKVKKFKIPSHFLLHAGTQKRNLVLLLVLLLLNFIFELWKIEINFIYIFRLEISFSQIVKFSQKKV
jgi:hypothetical protein